MESDLPLMEDDPLIHQFPDPNQTSSKYCSHFKLPPSHTKSLKDGVHLEKPSSSSSETSNNKENINSNNVELPKSGTGPMQMKRKKKGVGYNLRKSLAWDRAFFTDEGILDPLELTLVTGINANTCGGGLHTISEEGNSSFSSDTRCTKGPKDKETSEEVLLNDKSRTLEVKGDKTGCSVGNHDSSPHRKVTHQFLSIDHTNKGGSKVGVSEPLAASSLKRPANSNTLKTAKKESKLPKLPLSKPGSFYSATTKGSTTASQLRHNLIPKPSINVQKNVALKSSVKNVHGSQSKAKTGSRSLRLPIKEPAKKTVRNLTNSSSKATSSTKSRLVHVDRANSGSEVVPDRFQLCEIQDGCAHLAAKNQGQHTATNLNNSLPEAARLNSSGPCHIERVGNGLITSDRLHPSDTQEHPATLASSHHMNLHNTGMYPPNTQPARPSGLRLPSPSLRFFDQRTTSESGSLQQKKIQLHNTNMGSNRKISELRPPAVPARTPMKSTDITENVCSIPTSSGRCLPARTQLIPLPNYLGSTTNGVLDSDIYQNLEREIMQREDIKMQYECRGSEVEVHKVIEQEKRTIGHDGNMIVEKFAWNNDKEIEATHLTEQLGEGIHLVGNEGKIKVGVGNFHVMSQGHDERVSLVPETKGRFVLHNDDDGPQNIKIGQENDVAKVVDDRYKSSHMEDDAGCSADSPCNETKGRISITSRESLKDEAGNGGNTDARELEGTVTMLDTSSIPFQNMDTEQGNDDAEKVPVFPTRPSIRDAGTLVIHDHSSAEGFYINPSTSIETKVQLQDNPVRDAVMLVQHDNPQSLEKEGLSLAAATSEAEFKTDEENQKSQEMGIITRSLSRKSIVAEESQHSCVNMEANATIQGCTGGPETYNEFQSENKTLEGFEIINNFPNTHLEDAQMQLDSSLTPQNVDHSDIFVEQPELSDNGMKLEKDLLTNHQLLPTTDIVRQECVCKGVMNVVDQSDVYECDRKPSNTIVHSPPAGQAVGLHCNNNGQLCVAYGTSRSTGMDSISEHNENYSDRQYTYNTECSDLVLLSELKSSGNDEMEGVNTCVEYCSAGEESCSFLRKVADSMLEEEPPLFGEFGQVAADIKQVYMNESLSPEKNANLDKAKNSVDVVSHGCDCDLQNSNAGTLSPTVQGNASDLYGEDQPNQSQGFDGIMPLQATYDYVINERSGYGLESCGQAQDPSESSSNFPVSQRPTTSGNFTSTAFCSVTDESCSVSGGDKSLQTSTYKIGAEGSKISFEEEAETEASQEGKHPMVGEFHHELDGGSDLKHNKDTTAVSAKRSNSIKKQDNSLVIHPPNAVPFSDEWLAVIEAAGEEILTMKHGAVQPKRSS